MKLRQKRFLTFAVLMITVIGSASAADICDTCTKVGGLPVAQNTIGGLEKVAMTMNSISKDQTKYIESYCIKFQQIETGNIGSTLKEMENSPYPVSGYLNTPQCQAGGYNNKVKSPLLHLIGDDLTGRAEFLKKITMYFSGNEKIVKDALNAKNTEGETFLDYLETLRKKDNIAPEEKAILNSIISLACSKGGSYSFYKKSCAEFI